MSDFKDWFRYTETPTPGLMSFDGLATVAALDALRKEQHIGNLLAIMALYRAGECDLFERADAARTQLAELDVLPVDDLNWEG